MKKVEILIKKDINKLYMLYFFNEIFLGKKNYINRWRNFAWLDLDGDRFGYEDKGSENSDRRE